SARTTTPETARRDHRQGSRAWRHQSRADAARRAALRKDDRTNQRRRSGGTREFEAARHPVAVVTLRETARMVPRMQIDVSGQATDRRRWIELVDRTYRFAA